MRELHIKEIKSISAATGWYRVSGDRDNYHIERIAVFAVMSFVERMKNGDPYPWADQIGGVPAGDISVPGNEAQQYIENIAGYVYEDQISWNANSNQFVLKDGEAEKLIWE